MKNKDEFLESKLHLSWSWTLVQNIKKQKQKLRQTPHNLNVFINNNKITLYINVLHSSLEGNKQFFYINISF
jgi:short-subunit dehydrogenase